MTYLPDNVTFPLQISENSNFLQNGAIAGAADSKRIADITNYSRSLYKNIACYQPDLEIFGTKTPVTATQINSTNYPIRVDLPKDLSYSKLKIHCQFEIPSGSAGIISGFRFLFSGGSADPYKWDSGGYLIEFAEDDDFINAFMTVDAYPKYAEGVDISEDAPYTPQYLHMFYSFAGLTSGLEPPILLNVTIAQDKFDELTDDNENCTDVVVPSPKSNEVITPYTYYNSLRNAQDMLLKYEASSRILFQYIGRFYPDTFGSCLPSDANPIIPIESRGYENGTKMRIMVDFYYSAAGTFGMYVISQDSSTSDFYGTESVVSAGWIRFNAEIDVDPDDHVVQIGITKESGTGYIYGFAIREYYIDTMHEFK
jgi:hypothetical protein